MKRIAVLLLTGLALAGCGRMQARNIGLLKTADVPVGQLKVQEVPAELRSGAEGVAFFQRDGSRGVYVAHMTPPGVRMAVKKAYSDPGRIVLEVAEYMKDQAETDAAGTVAEAGSINGGVKLRALAVVLPQVPAADGRSILVQYTSAGSLYLGKELKTVEAVCHPSTAYSGVRYFFKPTDETIKETLFVDKGPTEIGEKVTAMELKEGEPVMVTYVVPKEADQPPQIVDVVRKPTVGMPGGPQ